VSSGLSVDCFEVGPLAENAYLVADRESGAAVIVDPGEEGERLVEAVEQAGVSLEAIWLTHAHFDHIGAVGAVRRRYEVPVLIHEADVPLFVAGPRQAASYGLSLDGDQAPSGRLEEGQALLLGRHEFTVWHTPATPPGTLRSTAAGLRWLATACSQGRWAVATCHSRTRRPWTGASSKSRNFPPRPVYSPAMARPPQSAGNGRAIHSCTSSGSGNDVRHPTGGAWDEAPRGSGSRSPNGVVHHRFPEVPARCPWRDRP
jgi:hypothetical protein